MLASLGNYGGLTRCMPPLPGSPAIEGALHLTGTLTDQLGNLRLSGPLPDLGAVEAISFSSLGLADNEPDGIPDIFEGPDGPYPHLSDSVDDSAADTDGDGSTDAEEIASMTNLYDANDKLRILSMVPADGFNSVSNPVFDITVTTFPGLIYSLEHDATLSTPFTAISSTRTANEFTETFNSVRLAPNKDFVRARRH